MKKKSFHIAIDEPCAESWQNMQQNADGKFCLHCSKTVIDFTQQTSYEIKSYFQQNKENTCGRFTKQQLDETYTTYEASKFDHYKFVASLALGLLTLDTLNAFSIDGKDFKDEKDSVQIVSMIQQNQIDSNKIEIVYPAIHKFGRMTNIQNDSVVLKGTVLDSATNEPLIGVNISIPNTTTGTVSDFEGNFEIKVIESTDLKLEFNYIAYNSLTKTILNPKDTINIKLSLDTLNEISSGIVITTTINKKDARKFKRKHKH